MKLKKWSSTLSVTFGLAVLVVLIGGMAICNYQAQLLVYNPLAQREPLKESPADYGLKYETLTLKTDDGYKLAAWYIPSQNRAAILVQHGYKNDRTSILPVAKILADHGYGVLMVDLRACGCSDGELVSFGLYESNDLEAAYQYLLRRQDVDAARIGAYGLSMGGVVVLLYAAKNPNIKAVIADSAFTSLQDEVAIGVKNMTGLPAFPFASMIQWFAERKAGFNANQIAPIHLIGKISPRPVFLMQGGADTQIRPDSGFRLYEGAGEPRELWFEPKLEHGQFMKKEEFPVRVTTFFDRYLLEKA
jgi:uncharacterized protein